jgi:hypothetical protein
MSTINIPEDVLTVLLEAAEASLPDKKMELKSLRGKEEAFVLRLVEDDVSRCERAIFDAKEALFRSLK